METAPAITIVPSKIARMRGISARWVIVPEWPPPPAPMQFSPSAPAAIAFSAKRMLVTSWNTLPPKSCTRATSSVGSPPTLMMISTPYLAQSAMFAASSSGAMRVG